MVPNNGLPWGSKPGPNSGTKIAPVPDPLSLTINFGGEL